MTSARVRSRTTGLTVHPRSASKGRTSAIARVMVERSTPNQLDSPSCVVACRRRERGQEPLDENQPMVCTRAHNTLPRPQRKLGLVPFTPQRAQLCDEFSNLVG